MQKDLTILGIAVVIGFLIGLYTGCHVSKKCPCDTITHSDTTQKKSHDSSTYQPPVIAVDSISKDSISFLPGGHIPQPSVYQPVSDYQYEGADAGKVVDTNAIIEDYFRTRHYSDTQTIKYGRIIINDIVTRDSIKLRTLITDFTIPMVNTNTVVHKGKAVGLIGFSLLGSKTDPIYSAGVNLGLKMPDDHLFAIGVKLIKIGGIEYEVQAFLPIHIKKQQ